MAEAILYDLAAGLISKVSSILLNEIVQWWGVKDDLQKLEETVSTIKAVLLDAEEQSVHNHQVKQWLQMLNEVMYDADDILDEFSYEALRLQLMGGSKTLKEVRLFFTSSNQLAFGLKMAHKLKKLRDRMDEIAANRRFHLEERPYVERRLVSPKTHSSPPQVVVGRENDKEEIVRVLLSSDCAESVQVVSVVGIGGLGKTALAQMVYKDDRLKSHFELKMWVCVSDNFDVELLVKNVLESASGQVPSSTQMDILKNQLHGKIDGRRYLLVLDDVWNEEVNKWSSFIDLLVVGARGSKILITTRSTTVAETSRATLVHELQGLPENESWSLFKQVAFNQSHHPSNQSREAIGREIVKKCCGVPLAIRTIGGVLYSKDPDTEWKSFKDNEMSKIDVFKHDILPILRLSYNHLPSPYKHCFAYCCLYPKDTRIPVDHLIQLWKAQGYIQPTNQSESLRDVCLKYFKDLLRLSFFQDVEEDRFGNIKYCKMHDLVHDMAVAVAGGYFYLSLNGEVTGIKNNIQHMSFWGHNKHQPSSLLKMKKMRTILNCRYVLKASEADSIFCNLRRLRVLDLSWMWISKLPNSIYKMKHLRYLDFSWNECIEELPNSLTNLHNLQGLNLEKCSRLKKLPSDISKLVNLTDLNNVGCYKLNYIPSGIGKLTKLEKLPEFGMEEDQSVSKHGAGLDELHSLHNLRGDLVIKLGFVENAESELKEGLLSSKQNLQILKLDWRFYGANDDGHEEKVMEALCPHPNLKELAVLHYRSVKPPSWLPSITNLVDVTIKDCSRIQRLPPLDQLPHLKKLEISGMPMLESIEVENKGASFLFFPSLTDLTLNNCVKLEGFEMPSTQEHACFPCLSYLHLEGCPSLTRLPISPELGMCDFDALVKLSSKELEVWGCKGANPPLWLTSITNLVVVTLKFFITPRLPPFDQLPHLQKLQILDSNKLESIEVENGAGSSLFFPSLTHLTLLKCPKLKGFERLSSLSKEELPSFPCLSKLCIYDCPNLIHLPLSPGLENLTLGGEYSLVKIIKMPENSALTFNKLQRLSITHDTDCTENELNDGIQWQSLEALRSVDLSHVSKLIALPKGLQYATSLQQLDISKCSSLACMPEWMPKLVALQHLDVNDSPQLAERCKTDSAVDWPYISHIPNITIDFKRIQRDGHYLL